jgi:hypothetical protein
MGLVGKGLKAFDVERFEAQRCRGSGMVPDGDANLVLSIRWDDLVAGFGNSVLPPLRSALGLAFSLLGFSQLPPIHSKVKISGPAICSMLFLNLR